MDGAEPEKAPAAPRLRCGGCGILISMAKYQIRRPCVDLNRVNGACRTVAGSHFLHGISKPLQGNPFALVWDNVVPP